MSNEKYVYLFVRQDLSLPQQIVQSNHATLSLASILPVEGVPNIVAIGVPDLPALKRVLAKLKQNQIQHFAWTEPDYDLGMTAIVTVPLDESRKQCLANYRLLRAGVEGRPSAGESPASRTNSPEAETVPSLQ